MCLTADVIPLHGEVWCMYRKWKSVSYYCSNLTSISVLCAICKSYSNNNNNNTSIDLIVECSNVKLVFVCKYVQPPSISP